MTDFFDPENGLGRQDRGRRGSLHCQAERRSTVSLPRRRAAAAIGRPGALGLGIATVWLSVIVLLPLAAVVVEVDRGRLGALLGHGHRAGSRSPR